MDLWRRLPISQSNSTDTWKGQCVANLDNYITSTNDTSDIFAGLVNRGGNYVNVTDANDVWGINVKVCLEYCGWDKLQTVFSFELFSSGATNYLLPWLALTAQLPFETGEYNVIAGIMSFCMALGSPMLITYSLMVTILNQHWIRAKFRRLENSDCSPLRETVKNARTFLQESQQAPLRLSQEDGSLGSLVVLVDNAVWWERLRKSIVSTRRGVTLSLVAQISVAILSWVLTIVTAFLSSLGNPTDALVLSSGSLWVWLVPIICGWVSVGTQSDHSTIQGALNRDEAIIASITTPPTLIAVTTAQESERESGSIRARSDPWRSENIEAVSPMSEKSRSRPPAFAQIDEHITFEREKQKAFRVAHHRDLMQPLLERSSTRNGPGPGAAAASISLEKDEYRIPGCMGFSVAGDERQEGPTFNYARVFTWWHVATQVHDAFEATSAALHTRRDLHGRRLSKLDGFRHEDVRGDPLSLLRYCGLTETVAVERIPGEDDDYHSPVVMVVRPRDFTEYPDWNELDPSFWQRIILSVLMGLFVQWGSTGAAIVIAYLTEVVGLGCRSGSYVIYGVLGTLSFALLFASSFLSHAAMLGHQAEQHRRRLDPAVAEAMGRHGGTVKNYSSSVSLGVLRIAAVTTRVLGRVLVIINTVWLILISLWELIGFFNNCWCDSVTLTRGSGGFVILFKGAQEMARAASAPWAGGIFLSVFVVAASSAVFWLFCRGNRR
ncbi:hypothetical protein BX600DRAFT_554690 [Xylariales sp. PMI_506]|nr:hypothetical protein BX600DRAFT_554690 [Xylariales sp. PMI_506]